ncbi:hypothetical protein HA466_0311430 [Hirschfeldia incana]|nr:hypothetical protein HA466_0311430 [Hirschfeldia incana]
MTTERNTVELGSETVSSESVTLSIIDFESSFKYGKQSQSFHRLKVLNKINDLLSVQRSLSQEKELELLFTQLSL